MTDREKILTRQVEEYAFKTVQLAEWLHQESIDGWSVDGILSDVDDAWYEEELTRHAH